MEVVNVPGEPGKLRVLLNHTEIPCYNDTDCPGAAICAINQTWQMTINNGTCMCNSWFGFTGATCTDFCAEASSVLGINTTTSILGLIVGSLAALLLLDMARARWLLKSLGRSHRVVATTKEQLTLRPRGDSLIPRFHVNPVAITLFFCMTGSFLFCAAGILNTLATVGMGELFVVLPQTTTGRLVKRTSPSLDYATNIVIALGYCFSVCAVVILPVTWIDITLHALKLKKSNTILVIAFAIVFTLACLGYELPFYVVVANAYHNGDEQRWGFAIVIGWGVIFSAIILLNLAAFFRVCSFRRDPAVLSDASVSRLLKRIMIASALIACNATAALICIFVFGLQDFRGYYSDPFCYLDTASSAFRAGKLVVVIGNSIALWFVYHPVRSIQSAVEAEKSRSSLESRAAVDQNSTQPETNSKEGAVTQFA